MLDDENKNQNQICYSASFYPHKYHPPSDDIIDRNKNILHILKTKNGNENIPV